MPVQGTSADIIKLAMIAIDIEFRKRKLSSRMLLQVHDELVFEVPNNEMEIVCPLVKNCMENAAKLDVPLVAQLSHGANWSSMQTWGKS